MSNVFTRPFRVRWSETNAEGHVDITSYLRYLIETAWDWGAARALAAAGWPPAELEARELVVSPRRFHILHQTPAVWGDRLALSVWLRALDETGGEWAIAVQRPADGAEIAQCTLRWTLADRSSGEARRLPASMAAALQDG